MSQRWVLWLFLKRGEETGSVSGLLLCLTSPRALRKPGEPSAPTWDPVPDCSQGSRVLPRVGLGEAECSAEMEPYLPAPTRPDLCPLV